MMKLKPVTSEKAIRMIESDNVLTFLTGRSARKENLKKELEELLNIKIEKINTLTRHNQKYAYVKLNRKTPAIDVATKMGVM